MGEVGAAPVVSVLGEMPMTGTPLMGQREFCCNCEDCIRKCEKDIPVLAIGREPCSRPSPAPVRP